MGQHWHATVYIILLPKGEKRDNGVKKPKYLKKTRNRTSENWRKSIYLHSKNITKFVC